MTEKANILDRYMIVVFATALRAVLMCVGTMKPPPPEKP